jgi:hypothetical protein
MPSSTTTSSIGGSGSIDTTRVRPPPASESVVLRPTKVPTSSTVRRPSVQPVFRRMRHRQGAGEFCMRGLGACLGAWHVQAAVQTLRTLHRVSLWCRAAGGWMDEKQENRA